VLSKKRGFKEEQEERGGEKEVVCYAWHELQKGKKHP
jgi:hypothetical protein